ncbi:hypothetical protein BH09MYX1_BH09MYX1_67760 [soil metagenome]
MLTIRSRGIGVTPIPHQTGHDHNDNDVTLPELCKQNIDPLVYNTSGLPGASIGDCVISLARTIGHYRGEGECTIKRIDTPPAGAVNACDEYK